MSNDLTKYEVNEAAEKAGFSPAEFLISHQDALERFATLCRAPLVAENAAMKQAHEINADTLNAMQVEIDDWKARAEAAEEELARVQAVAEWQGSADGGKSWRRIDKPRGESIESRVAHLRNMTNWQGRPIYLIRALYTTPQPAAQEPTSAAPVVKQLVEALEGVVVGADESRTQACKELNSMGITSVPVSNASAGLINRQIEAIDVARTAIAAGQKFIKESGK